MIFVTVGTHPADFKRILMKIDQIAPHINEKIVMQTGYTDYVPKNVEYFAFADNLEPYFEKARLVISHAATSLLEFILIHKKPLLIIPRRAMYGEHINDHQVEFAQYFSARTGVKTILESSELTPQLLKTYTKIAVVKKDNLHKLQRYFKQQFDAVQRERYPSVQKPYAHSRTEYIINLLNPKKSDRILNIGVSNIPEVEMFLENTVKECSTIDIDKKKMDRAASKLKKTKLIYGDVHKYQFKKPYDSVVMIEVLEHLDHDEVVLKKLHSILKKGGSLIIGVPNTHLLHVINPVKYAEHKRHYTKERLVRILKNAGFKIEHLNEVENYTLLVNLYIHLFNKFVLNRQVPFGVFSKSANRTYRQHNTSGMDIIVKAVKL